MKNLLLLCIIALCLYLYLNPKAEQEQPRPTAVAAAPVATGPKYYYHSPLDAPAMPTGMSTGSGYYSTEASGRFSNFHYHSPVIGGAQAAGGPTVYGAGGSTYNSTAVYGNSSRGASGSSASSTTSYVGGRDSGSPIRSSDLRRLDN